VDKGTFIIIGVFVGAFLNIVYLGLTAPTRSYMIEIDSINYSVKTCNLTANVLTYTQDGLTISQVCNDCKCQRRISDN